MNYILVFPPNTKDAPATRSKWAIKAICPHCQEAHFHPKGDVYKSYIAAPCGKGYYVLRVKP